MKKSRGIRSAAAAAFAQSTAPFRRVRRWIVGGKDGEYVEEEERRAGDFPPNSGGSEFE